MEISPPTFDEPTIATIQRVIKDQSGQSRSVISREVCRELHWRSASGRLSEMSCRLALNRLAQQGRLSLPPARRIVPRGRYRCRDDRRSYCRPDPIICTLDDLGDVRLVLVSAAESALNGTWRELTARHHYLGAGPLCGRQLRYLVESERYGWVGTLAFSSAALHLEARDGWIGWDEEARQQHLGQVVCNARFLLLPWVEVPNLASKVLSLCPERVRCDWRCQYGVTPVLLETFVDSRRYHGSCYAGAGWTDVGKTKGRGRQDRDKRFAVGCKRVLVLPLQEDACAILCAKKPVAPTPIAYHEESPRSWEETELGAVDLGDERLNRRVGQVAAAFFSKPTSSIPEACGGAAAARGAYRLFSHSEVAMEKLLLPHYEATAGRVASAGGTVLAVQDTTTFNYSAHPATTGMGPIGSQEDGPVGMLLHDTMAFTLAGTPLGLIDAQCWTRDPEEFGQSRAKRNVPIEDKESIKWLSSYRAASALQQRVPTATVVSTGDREADIYELFALAAATPCGAKLLVRASHNRILKDECQGLKEYIVSLPVAAVVDVPVPRRGRRPARVLAMELRYRRVLLSRPAGKTGPAELVVNVVHVREQTVADDEEPVEWWLLTTCEATTVRQAFDLVQWYAKRWGIEVYHRIIKSGCRVEDRQLGTESRIENCLALDLIVAWRVFLLTMLGRECPDLPCTVCLETDEWQVLSRKYTGAVPATPPSMREALIMLGRLGGYIARPKDYLPGAMTVWQGLITLMSMVEGWRLAFASAMPNGP